MAIAGRDVWFAVAVLVCVQVELHGHSPLSAIIACGLLVTVVTRRWPLGVLVAACGLLLVDAVAGGILIGDLLTPLVSVASVAFIAGRRRSWVALIVAGAASAAILVVANQAADPGSFSIANDAVFFLLLILVPGTVGRLIDARQVEQLCQVTGSLERQRELTAQAARALEGNRVEQAVETALVGRLHSITVAVDSAVMFAVSRPEAVPGALAAVETAARSTLEALREVLGVLGPTTSTDPLIRNRDEQATDMHAEAPHRRGHHFDLLDVALMMSVVPLAVELGWDASPAPWWPNLVACAAQAVMLVRARRRVLQGALGLYAVACIQTAVLAPLPDTVSWLLVGLVLAFLLGNRTRRGHHWWGLAASALGMAAVELSTPDSAPEPVGTAAVLVASCLVWWAGRSVASLQHRAAELDDKVAQLIATADLHARVAAAEHRAGMARELHDTGAHMLTVMSLQSVAAQALWDRDRQHALEALAVMRELSEGPLTHLGDSLQDLADTSGSVSLVEVALGDLGVVGRTLGLDIAVRTRGTPRPVPADTAKVAARVVQESLTNAARHAHGGSVRVQLSYTANELQILVSDTGGGRTSRIPAAIKGSGNGLHGMRERVESRDGHLDYGPGVHGGFEVRARLSLATP